jgi:hypothetical protein
MMTTLQLSNLARQAALDEYESVKARYEQEKGDVPQDLFLKAIADHERLAVAHAQRTNDPVAAIDAKLRARNERLNVWRATRARFEAGRVGGEAYNEALARVDFFESHARVSAFADDEEGFLKQHRLDLSLPRGDVPKDVNLIADKDFYNLHSLEEGAYFNCVVATEDALRSIAARKKAFLGEFFLLEATSTRYLELVALAPDGSVFDRFELVTKELRDLRRLFGKLPNGRYQLYDVCTDVSLRRLVMDVYVRRGRPIDPSDDSEGARDRPPTSESDGRHAATPKPRRAISPASVRTPASGHTRRATKWGASA